jgi:hypothetical protein
LRRRGDDGHFSARAGGQNRVVETKIEDSKVIFCSYNPDFERRRGLDRIIYRNKAHQIVKEQTETQTKKPK